MMNVLPIDISSKMYEKGNKTRFTSENQPPKTRRMTNQKLCKVLEQMLCMTKKELVAIRDDEDRNITEINIAKDMLNGDVVTYLQIVCNA